MSEAHLDDQRDIDAILAAIRAEVGASHKPQPAMAEDRRTLSVVRVEMLDESDEGFASDRRSFDAGEFEGLDELAFLRTAYRSVLGRDIDESGLAHYLPLLREGHTTPREILRSLRASPEGQARGVEITSLESRFGLDRLRGVPVVGGVVSRLRRYLSLPQNLRRLQRRVAAADRRRRETVTALNASLTSIRRSLQKLEQQNIEAQHRADQAAALAREAIDGRDAALSELAASRRQLTEQSSNLARLIDQARLTLPVDDAAGARSIAPIEDAALDSLYVAFENRFRGSTDLIAGRQRRYLDMFRLSPPVLRGGVVLDIGCGRGEWLSLLRDANIAARGIDLNGAMVAEASAQGLAVEEGDAIAHLRAAPAESLAAVTGFHIVEHLAFRDLVALFDAAFAALGEDGFVLFETPNPENLVVGACTFNYDPTHNKPLPPDLLRFIAEARGFTQVRIIRRDEDCRLDQPESGFTPAEINDWFRQPGDYAVYARKSWQGLAA
ncbi:methyltransferase domain-containing protein [Tianweitania sediminis]|uniref:Methyltransferase domain-containing protein n=1 Tax=Tianweitania sediminis TaxID=1502156 RepID=A0A8J7R962_9HYPH|nr:methyltransferase domain-containing protein [Tianweitania sediminis]MBP0441205.1 methyltransferase domain-containing protein [Tianweitania sediminis]